MRRLLFYGDYFNIKVLCCIYRSMRTHILVSVLNFKYLTSSLELMIGCKLHFLMFGYTPPQCMEDYNFIAKLCKSKALEKFAKRPRTEKKYRTAVVFACKSSFKYICRKYREELQYPYSEWVLFCRSESSTTEWDTTNMLIDSYTLVNFTRFCLKSCYISWR